MSNYAKLAVGNSPKSTGSKKGQLGGATGKGWLPGQSGNPSGRPKSKPITDMLRPIFEDPETVDLIRANVKKTLTDKGMAGVILLSHIADRLEGKMPEEVNINDCRNMTDEELEKKLEELRAARS